MLNVNTAGVAMGEREGLCGGSVIGGATKNGSRCYRD